MESSALTREQIDKLFVQAWEIEKEGDKKKSIEIYRCSLEAICNYKKTLTGTDLEPVNRLNFSLYFCVCKCFCFYFSIF